MQNQFDFNRSAIRPIQCLSDGYEMLKGFYGNFLLVMIVGGLIMMVTVCIPLAPLIPPTVCGLYICMFSIMRREPVDTSTLFQGFKFIGQSFVAFLIFSVLIFILSIILQVGIHGISDTFENLTPDKYPSDEAIYVLFILVIPMAFVYPLIVDRKLSGFQAIKLSMRAVFGNFFGVIGLTLLGYLLLIAGSLFFCVGALFVAPFVFASWAVAYGRVFNIQIPQSVEQMNEPRYSEMSPPLSTSKAGWVLTLSAALIVSICIVTLSFYSYRATDRNKNNHHLEKKVDEKDMPTVTYPSSTF